MIDCGCYKLESVLAQVPKAVPDMACGRHVWGGRGTFIRLGPCYQCFTPAEGKGNSLSIGAMCM